MGIKVLKKNRDMYREDRREVCDLIGYETLKRLEDAGYMVVKQVFLLSLRDSAWSDEHTISLLLEQVGRPEPPPIDESAPWFVECDIEGEGRE